MSEFDRQEDRIAHLRHARDRARMQGKERQAQEAERGIAEARRKQDQWVQERGYSSAGYTTGRSCAVVGIALLALPVGVVVGAVEVWRALS